MVYDKRIVAKKIFLAVLDKCIWWWYNGKTDATQKMIEFLSCSVGEAEPPPPNALVKKKTAGTVLRRKAVRTVRCF